MTTDSAVAPRIETWISSLMLSPREVEKLVIYQVAGLARRRRTRGLKLNFPEAISLITEALLEAARDGMPVADAIELGRKVLTRSDVMWQAWCDVAANHGASGVDGMTIESIASRGVEGVQAFLGELAERIRTDRYRPAVLRRVYIPKPGRSGEQRPLSIPTVADRVVMTAAKLVLEPIFEADFLPVSFGFRPRRSTHDALEVIRVEANRGREWVLDADVANCLGAWSHCSFR